MNMNSGTLKNRMNKVGENDWFSGLVIIVLMLMLMLEMHFVAFAVLFSSAMATVDSFFGDVDSLNTSLLLATQRLAKIAENSGNENTEVGETADEGRVKTTDHDALDYSQRYIGYYFMATVP